MMLKITYHYTQMDMQNLTIDHYIHGKKQRLWAGIAISKGQAKHPKTLSKTLIGEKTEIEINWKTKN